MNEENRKKAKEHLREAGLQAIHLRGKDPTRPTAIGTDVLVRDPFTYVTYPDFPVISPKNTTEFNVGAGSEHHERRRGVPE
ncbi:hypothetical protein BCR43DRAFT_518836 [Syncephalastrum racemosum]|uniref:Uncharacterized protein n=1 Tax=Syncephalastrum racemosum TaxID=13706 RepID=A0A1X2GZV6_SYNRA|nr:hypothetical protein BCR43DRAFT_518836 [Syncephalastrum racemosum]